MSKITPLFKTVACVLNAAGNQDGEQFELPASPHYNAVTTGTFASVLGLDHQQLVDEAVTEKAATSPPLH